jgi:hypothetical protein
MPERCERVAKDEAAMKSGMWYYEGFDEVFDGVRLPPLGNDFFQPGFKKCKPEPGLKILNPNPGLSPGSGSKLINRRPRLRPSYEAYHL